MNYNSANVLCHTSNRLKKPVTPYSPGSLVLVASETPREALMRKGLVTTPTIKMKSMSGSAA